jgi:hypothetical protein
MNELQHHLTQNFAGALDRFNEHMGSSDVHSLDDIKRMMPLSFDMLIAQWAASLDIKTKHDMMRSSIDGIR